MKLQALALVSAVGFLVSQVKPGPVEFSADVAPILKGKCVSCHGPDVQSGGLRLDTPEGLKKGGESGPLWTAGKGADSLLIRRILGKGNLPRMPMGFAPLSPSAVAKIQAWIDQGAVISAPKKHWAYVPPVRPKLPGTKNQGWARNEIDRFVLARLEKEGLKPALEATKEQLARRAALDLTGLPPTVAELDRFLVDKAPGAYERYVDRLLASPHYGERMARTWMDLARYADTNGYEKDLPRQMWLWRDWVIDAFNRNMPFDQFTIEQLAGDLLPNPTVEQLIATGFNRNSMLNDEGGTDAEEFRVVAVMDRIDATSTTWLGSTLACAQCHDHKYDPFTQRDYYQMFAYFNQSQDNGRDMTPAVKKIGVWDMWHLAELTKSDGGCQGLLAQAEKKLLTPEGMARSKARQALWKSPKPSQMTAQATLNVDADGWILASGADPDQDTYEITLPVTEAVRGIRLQVGPDPSLPGGSSGRNTNGSFVLDKVEVELHRANGEVAGSGAFRALADFTQEGHDPMTLVKSEEGSGWAVAAFEPAHKKVHTVVLERYPTDPMPGDTLVVRLKHSAKFPHHNLGHFRISITADRELAQTSPPSAEVLALMTKPDPSEAEQKMLRDYLFESSPDVMKVRASQRRIETERQRILGKSPSSMIMSDLEKPRENHILKRGDFRTPGDKVSPAPPAVLGGAAGAGNRLGLAKWLVSPKNPLTARVEVNRLWEQCFGKGLVATPEDFGTQGDRPSHPELLDWLATEFMARKWDLKVMLRKIVTSATYRQSARATPALLKKDPYNVLLARGPRFRMEAEGVRDIALTASGLLTETIGGPSVMPPQPGGIWENSFSFYDTSERWVDATGPNRFRRGLYTYWRRTAPYPMALTFDMKSRDMCVAHRARTNSPLQALNLMNDPVFLECAATLGQKMGQLGGEKGLVYGFRACTSRAPRATELAALKKLLTASRTRFGADGKAAADLLRAGGVTAKEALTTENAAWMVVANAVLNLDESISK
ncbi:MAG: hypothetical protein BGO01_12360 [Armatimonadetes bacterium 55-13]|nr:PSD1 domain-containing protein [Armatimonadota bacterium]ODU53665.1 MAG: hypothetical protein ABT09_01420 [bacterium SCN 57-13]OJU61706.1 MAG: hypothetical protein BGO01_12360 [Armatimonadetes bacterium 55-13]